MNLSKSGKTVFTHILKTGTVIALTLCLFPAPKAFAIVSDNPKNSDIDFPGAEATDFEMNNNYGTIVHFTTKGILHNNEGTIKESSGEVTENNGIIETQNNGVIRDNKYYVGNLTNSGQIIINSANATVDTSINSISINYGTVNSNGSTGSINVNYGQIGDNKGTVTMRSGSVTTNGVSGKLKFMSYDVNGETLQPSGTVNSNAGKIEISAGSVDISENSGDIIIDGGIANITKNTGTVTLQNNAKVTCTDNFGSIVENGTSNQCTCTNNYATVNCSNSQITTQFYQVKFTGEDGKAYNITCEHSENGVYYSANGHAVEFCLPSGYGCKDAKQSPVTSGALVITTRLESTDTFYEIKCHKCSSDTYKSDADKHWKECSECGNISDEASHNYGDYTSDNNSTCTQDGTKTRKCTICSHNETVTDTDSHLSSGNHSPVTDPRVEPTKDKTGLTEGSHCSRCGKILVAQQVLPKLDEGGKTPPPDNKPNQTKPDNKTDINKANKGDSVKPDEITKDKESDNKPEEKQIAKSDEVSDSDNLTKPNETSLETPDSDDPSQNEPSGADTPSSDDLNSGNGQAVDTPDVKQKTVGILPLILGIVGVTAVGAGILAIGITISKKK